MPTLAVSAANDGAIVGDAKRVPENIPKDATAAFHQGADLADLPSSLAELIVGILGNRRSYFNRFKDAYLELGKRIWNAFLWQQSNAIIQTERNFVMDATIVSCDDIYDR